MKLMDLNSYETKDYVLLEKLKKICHIEVIDKRKKAEPLNSIYDYNFF